MPSRFERLSEISRNLARLTPANEKKARSRLIDLALSLNENNFEWAAAAISAHLVGDAKTLDTAFGLVPTAKPGRRRTEAGDRLMELVFRRRLAKRSWKQIADEISKDEREVRRMYARRVAQLRSDELKHRGEVRDRRPRKSPSG